MKIIEISKNKLNNSNFIQKAPKDIIDKEKELLKSNSLELDKLKEIINTVVWQISIKKNYLVDIQL